MAEREVKFRLVVKPKENRDVVIHVLKRVYGLSRGYDSFVLFLSDTLWLASTLIEDTTIGYDLTIDGDSSLGASYKNGKPNYNWVGGKRVFGD